MPRAHRLGRRQVALSTGSKPGLRCKGFSESKSTSHRHRLRYHGNRSIYVIDYVIYGLWVLFWLVWLAAALTAKRAAQSRMRQFVGLRVALFVILILVGRSGAFKGHRAIVSNP